MPFEIPPPGAGGTAYLRFQDSGIAIVAEAQNGIVWVFDETKREAAALIPDLSSLPAAEHDTRLRHPLQMILSAAERPLVHGALVGLGDRGALIPGRSGAGKSTLALSCIRAGLDFCSDDYIVLAPDEGRGHGLLQTAKLTPDSAIRLGMERDPAGLPWRYEDRGAASPKATVEVTEITNLPPRRSMGIALVLSPRIAGAPEPYLEPIAAMAAIRALMPTLVQQPTRDPNLFASMTRIVRSVPCFELALSGDPTLNAAAVRTALEQVQAGRSA